MKIARRLILPIALAWVILASLWWPTIDHPLGRDQGLFAAVADALLDGGVLYRDAFDLKPPLIYWLYETTLVLWHSAWAIRLMDLVLLGLTLGFALALFPRRRQWTLAPLLALTFGLSQFSLASHWDMAVPDQYLALPVLVGLWLRKQHPLSPRMRILCGLLAGVAFWLKLTGGIYLIFFLLLDGRDAWRRGSRSLGRLPLWWGQTILGFLIAVVAVLAHFALHGALRDLWEAAFVYPVHYAGYQAEQSGDLWIAGYNVTHAWRGISIFARHFPLLVWPPLAFGVLCLIRRRWIAPTIWLALALALLSIAVQRKFFLNHFGAVSIWLALLTALLFETLGRLARVGCRRRHRLPSAVIAWPVGLILILSLAVFSSVFPERLRDLRAWWELDRTDPASMAQWERRFGTYNLGDYSHRANMLVADYIADITEPGDRIFIWGFEPAVYFHADRRSPSRFLISAPLVDPPPGTSWREEFMADLEANPPAVICTLSQDDQWYLHGVHGDSTQTLIESFPEFAQWIMANFTPDVQIEHFAVWRR
ncbi:hypothetical protein JXA47_04355 [Candidatus Sumerlaeota bacterium]|nr:hypothetical protein [Candidatus Sumerlaeota bacterium]